MAGNRIEITDEIRAKLEAEKERSGIGVRQLMRGRRGEYPEGLRADMVDGWIAGRTATARRDHLDWVLRAWASYTPSEPKKDPGPARIDLSVRLPPCKRKPNARGLAQSTSSNMLPPRSRRVSTTRKCSDGFQGRPERPLPIIGSWCCHSTPLCHKLLKIRYIFI